MDLRKLKTLVDLVSESNISELEITEAEGKVRIVKAAPAPAAAPAAAAPVVAVAPPSAAMAAATPAPAPAGRLIKSPMVGTFYRAASPGAKPFIELGSEVKEGDPVCIVEAMKIMNEIEAELSGVVREVCVEDASPVEYGQVLYRVDPNG